MAKKQQPTPEEVAAEQERSAADARNAARLRATKDADLMDLYVKLRDDLTEKAAAFKKANAKQQRLMDQIEGIMIERLDLAGVKNAASEHTTVFFEDKTFCNVSDWDELLAFIIDSAEYHFLNHAVRKESVKAFMDSNEGATPPGVKWTEERALVFRKK